MKISNYVPKMYENNLEMHILIDSEEVELEESLKPNIDNSFKDTFATVATEKGISNFEKLFNIKADPISESLEFRRARVINRLVSKIPYSEKFLQLKLDEMLGAGNWTYTMNYGQYTLTINSLIPGREWYKELLQFLDMIIPCNIDWEVIVYAATWAKVSDSYTTWNDIYETEMTWQELMDAQWSE